MNLAGIAPRQSYRKLGAWVCLLAALLLWSPFVLASVAPVGKTCCSNGMCSAMHHNGASSDAMDHGHHGSAMECEHSAGSSMDCGMSCCQPQASSILPAPLLYVVTPATLINAQATGVRQDAAKDLPDVIPTFEPQSPPPRFPS